MERQILHVDVNNAFLSWTAVEELKNGANIDIRTIPSIIGGDEEKRKGVVLAKSNIAKQFGIKTGEPIYFARKKCPKILVINSNFGIYIKYSNKLYELLSEYTNEIQRFSIDECFMDLTHFLAGRKIMDIAQEIKYRVKKELGFTVNIGIAHNKLLAKMASDFEKPDKIHTLYENEIEEKMWKLNISDLFMVGRKNVPKLEKMGIKTIGDLAKKQEKDIHRIFGKYGKLIWEYANGIDNSKVEYEKEKPKCIGNSITLPHDERNIEKIEEILLALTEQVTYRLRKQRMLARVVGVTLKTSDFVVNSHQKKLNYLTDSTKIIYEEVKKLLIELYKDEPIRLIGVKVERLEDEKEKQISLFESKEQEKQGKLDKVIDELKNKYGYNKVTRAGKMQVNNIINLKEEKK